MSLNVYEVFALFYIPISLIAWTIDFLSDKEIVHSELEIGIIHYLHYLAGIMQNAILILLCSKSIFVTVLSIIIVIGTQIGFLINKDYCWLLRLTNTKINPKKPNRKARVSLESFIKHYIRGDEWAYSDIRNSDATKSATVMNVLLILQLIKLIMFNY
jgi:hypothetical protein